MGDVDIEVIEENYPGNDSDDVKDLVPWDEVTKDPAIYNKGANEAIVFMTVTLPVDSGRDVLEWKKDDGDYNSTDDEWTVLDRFVYKDADGNVVTDKNDAATVMYVYGWPKVLPAGETTDSLFDMVRIANNGNGIAGSVVDMVIDGYAIQRSHVTDIPDGGNMDGHELTRIYDILVSEGADDGAGEEEERLVIQSVSMEIIDIPEKVPVGEPINVTYKITIEGTPGAGYFLQLSGDKVISGDMFGTIGDTGTAEVVVERAHSSGNINNVLGETFHSRPVDIEHTIYCLTSGDVTFADGENKKKVSAEGTVIVFDGGTYEDLSNWDYTLDDESGYVYLNHYIGDETDVYVYKKYAAENGNEYVTQISDTADKVGLFSGCKNIESVIFDTSLDTHLVTDTSYMFNGCPSLKILDLGELDTSNVTDMSYMFHGCISLKELDVCTLNTSNVTNMDGMFNGLSSLSSLDISTLNTGKVTSMYGMFANCSSLTSLDLSMLDTHNVTTMYFMFNWCKALTSVNVNGIDTSSLTDVRAMFQGCESLKSLDLSRFDTSNVTRMDNMIGNCHSLTSVNLTGFDTSKATSLYAMFTNCDSLTSLDLTMFVVNENVNTQVMFNKCPSLTTIYVSSSWKAPTTQWLMFTDCGTDHLTYK